MLKYLVRGQHRSRQVLAGEPIGGSLSKTPNPSGLTISLDSTLSPRDTSSQADAVQQRVQGSFVENRYAWSFDDTHRTGFLTVTYDDPTVDEELFAVNVDTHESDLARLAAADFLAELRLEATVQPNAETLLTVNTAPRSLSRWLLFPVLGLLLIEVLLVWLFSRGAG